MIYENASTLLPIYSQVRNLHQLFSLLGCRKGPRKMLQHCRIFLKYHKSTLRLDASPNSTNNLCETLKFVSISAPLYTRPWLCPLQKQKNYYKLNYNVHNFFYYLITLYRLLFRLEIWLQRTDVDIVMKNLAL